MPFTVALFTRVWIEINQKLYVDWYSYVALFTRVWIEMDDWVTKGLK